MNIDIWSDVACPFCYIGKAHFEKALKELPDSLQVNVTWKSFELDPNAPKEPTADIYDTLATKYGKDRNWAIQMNKNMTQKAEQAGLKFNMDDVKPVNTFNAHRVIHLAKNKGLQHEMKERLLKAYFTEGVNVADPDELARLGYDVGLNRDEILTALNEKQYTEEVVQDIEQAHKIGVQGVPFFLINNKYGLSGAQPVDVFVNALTKIEQES
ncbi:DsbA family oxidoreductase [Gracilimonas amylolytica]|uniref:DsbA family oxidoreductase n=1 Tax=Gracilimonas amylolytica TaxID=1749045 RepID=UPI000CD80825|nr:DsbA family oxidoreductase [Gracilimonas amylolytica]